MFACRKYQFGGGSILRRLNIVGHTCVLLDFSLTVKAAPHECVIRTNQP